ncbi:hypothetical protein DPEC_G00173970, partial [Dallia pectoralis]
PCRTHGQAPVSGIGALSRFGSGLNNSVELIVFDVRDHFVVSTVHIQLRPNIFCQLTIFRRIFCILR